MTNNYKIVITGAFAAGKTQFIRSVSEIEVVDTEAAISHELELALKTQTTVALDFGQLTIDAEHKLFLFGTPGQERFAFMRDQLSIGCLGYVVVVDSCRPGHFAETRQLLNDFAQLTNAPFVVAANKQDDPGALPPSYITRRLELPPHVPVLPCVATDPRSVRDVLLALTDRIAATLGLDAETVSPVS